MNRLIVILILGMFGVPMASFSWAAEPPSEAENSYPDLLVDSQSEKTYGPDLLKGDPYVPGPVKVLGDPIFEDDYTFNKPKYIVWDPLEPVNRVFFQVNDKLYFWVLKPVKTGYAAVLPEDIRMSLGNFFTNFAAPIRFINNILQGEIDDAGIVLGRFIINSTLGVFGLGDPAARDFDIKPQPADFGQTLGKWGLDEGIYLFWPAVGPSSIRDTIGLVGDVYMHPVPYVTEDAAKDLTYLVVDRINKLSLGPGSYEELKRMSLDPYVASRQAYYEYRRAFIESR